MDIKFCINFNEYKQVIAEKGDFKVFTDLIPKDVVDFVESKINSK